MDKWYVMIYYIPLLSFWLWSLIFGDRKPIIITTLSVVAWLITRLIDHFVTGGHELFDFANDLIICAILVTLFGKDSFVRYLVFTYTLMMITHSLHLAEYIPADYRNYTIEGISFLQLLLILGVTANGTGTRTSYKYFSNVVRNGYSLVQNRRMGIINKLASLKINRFNRMGGIDQLEKDS